MTTFTDRLWRSRSTFLFFSYVKGILTLLTSLSDVRTSFSLSRLRYPSESSLREETRLCNEETRKDKGTSVDDFLFDVMTGRRQVVSTVRCRVGRREGFRNVHHRDTHRNGLNRLLYVRIRMR